jgi:hypothetical protein
MSLGLRLFTASAVKQACDLISRNLIFLILIQ